MTSAAPKPAPTPEEILESALKLSKDQRERLAQQLLESTHGEPQSEIESAWTEEIADRVEALERGEAKTVDASVVFERLRAKHAR